MCVQILSIILIFCSLQSFKNLLYSRDNFIVRYVYISFYALYLVFSVIETQEISNMMKLKLQYFLVSVFVSCESLPDWRYEKATNNCVTNFNFYAVLSVSSLLIK